MNWNEIREKLKEPFLPEEIEWRVGSTTHDKTRGLAVAYVTNRAIQDRLDDTFGPSGWQNEFRVWKGESQICGISVWDDEKGQWITKWDGADDSQTEATKGGLSDAMKRAAYQWGIGRYLYKLPSSWVAIEPIGKSFRLKETPQLPDWALPKGYQKTQKSGNKQTTTTTTVTKEQPSPATGKVQPETGKDQGAMLGKIPQPQIAAYYARLTKVGCAPKMGEIIARTILPRDAFHEDNTISWSKVSEDDFKRLCDVYDSDKWETIMQAIFYRYTSKSGATSEIINLIVQHLLHGKQCLDIKTGLPMWCYVSKEDFDTLWNTFRGNNWQEYFNRMNGATDLRDVG
jgi:hypothetical protein